ncbi:unnamed protein product [Acanthoscelides obtectus]|nr:unnamed protein product [Acanthoscelides obtectus]CAK1664046.1 Putative fatty acyl-CoA reductase CG5065 [Acanthoscelides obtectus]
MVCDPNKTADLVPVDMVINLMIVSAWRVGTTKPKELQIYNCVTGQRKPITWQQFIDLCFKYMRKHPFSDVFWYPNGSVSSNRTLNTFNWIFLHWIPAHIIDSFVWLTGGRPIMVKIQNKLTKAASCLEYFTTQQWQFNDENVRNLVSTLNEVDKEVFCFDVAKIDWNKYIEDYVLGIRRFIFKEERTSLPKARRQMSKLYWSYRIMQVVSVLLTWHFLTTRYAPLRRLWTSALHFLMHIASMLPFV